MKKLVWALALVCSTAVPLSAQVPSVPSGCTKCGVYGYVDGPGDPVTAVPIVSGGWTISGWGFECVSGIAVDRVDVFASNDDGTYTPIPPAAQHLYLGYARPDVQQAYQGACPAVSGVSGFAVQLDAGAVPVGTRALVMNLWRGPYFAQTRRIVVIR